MSINQGGWLIYTFSSRMTLRNALLKSSCLMVQLLEMERASTTQMVVGLIIGLYVS